MISSAAMGGCSVGAPDRVGIRTISGGLGGVCGPDGSCVSNCFAPKAESHDVSREEVLARLRAVDLLAPLSEMAQSDVAEAAHIHFYAKGETILQLHGIGPFVINFGPVPEAPAKPPAD